MQRTDVWTTSEVTFAVLCLLLSGCGKAPPQAEPPTPPPEVAREAVQPVEQDNDGFPDQLDELPVAPVAPVDAAKAATVATAVEEVAQAEAALKEAVSARDEYQVVQVQQWAMVARASVQVIAVEDAADDLGLLVKQQRFARLDVYAQKYHWNMEAPPERAKERPQIAVWWREWRDLRVQGVGRMMARVPPEEGAASVPPAMPIEVSP